MKGAISLISFAVSLLFVHRLNLLWNVLSIFSHTANSFYAYVLAKRAPVLIIQEKNNLVKDCGGGGCRCAECVCVSKCRNKLVLNISKKSFIK